MSKQVDERVVSMQFDNRNFEENVRTSMSTLDKLKEKLNFKGAQKGFENISSAANKVNMNPLSRAVEGIGHKFSAMEVMGVTALANVTNSAVNYGKRIAAALTIDPVKTGFNEYELKMNSVKTIMASTGEDIATVNKYLDELNKYSDETIYSFSDMTQNIGKFTNAGVKLEDAVMAIKGISNEAAVSGANANEASRAMYNFSQALSAGYVKLIDWKSIELANMATVEFKQQLIDTAVEVGTLTKTTDGYKTAAGNSMSATKNFNETLQDQWMTSDVLIKTLGKYSDETTDIGKKATAAAKQVNTFSKMLETLKESAQSGWARTWEIVFGDLDVATAFWTNLSEAIGGFLNKISNIRNNLLEAVLGNSKWDSFNAKIKEAGVSTDKFNEALEEVAKERGLDVEKLTDDYDSLVKAIQAGAAPVDLVTAALKKLAGSEKETSKTTEDATDKLEKFQKLVNKVWKGDYANGEARIKALTDAGYDYSKVQELVNKSVDGHKLTLEDLSDAQLTNIGYTEEEIKSIRELAEEAEKAGTDLNTLISELDTPSGRDLLFESLGNSCKALGGVFAEFKKAWQEVFPPISTEKKANAIYNFLLKLRDFTETLKMSEETAEKFRKTFNGVFSILKLIGTLVGGPIKIAFKLLQAILSEFDMNILDLTSVIGENLTKFANWADSLIDFEKVAEKIVPPIKDAIKAFKAWIETLKTSENLPRDIINGLLNGLKAGLKAVGNAAMNIGKVLIEKVKQVLGIHSPSKEFFEIGQNTILGLVNGLKNGAIWLFHTAKSLILKLVDYVKGMDTGTLIAGVIAVSLLAATSKIAKAIRGFVSPFDGVGDFMDSFSKSTTKLFKSIGTWFKAMAVEKISKALINLAIAVAILTASIIALTLADQDKMTKAVWTVVGLTVGLAAVMIALTVLAARIQDFKASFANAALFVGLAFALITIAAAVIMLGKMDINELKQGGIAAGIIVGVIIALMAASRLISGMSVSAGDKKYNKIGKDLVAFGKMLRKIATSLLIITLVIKLLGSMRSHELLQGTTVVIVLLTAMVGIMAATKLLPKSEPMAFSNVTAFGKMFQKVAFSLLLFAAAIKIFGSMETSTLVKGGSVVAIIMVVMAGIMVATQFIPKNEAYSFSNITGFGKMFTKLAWTLLLFAAAIKIFGSMETSTLVKGGTTIAIILGAMVGIMAATRLLAKFTDQPAGFSKVGSMFMKLAVALLVISFAINLIGNMDGKKLAKGILGVAGIFAAMTIVMASTRLLTKNKASITGLTDAGKMMISMSIAVALMAGALMLLTFINPDKLDDALNTMFVILLGFAGIMAATKTMKIGKGSLGVIIGLIAAISVLCGALVSLSFVDPERLRIATTSLTVIIGALALLIMSTSKLNVGSANKGSVRTYKEVCAELGLLVGAVAVLAGALIWLSHLDPYRVATSAGAMVVIIGAFALLMKATKSLPKGYSTINKNTVRTFKESIGFIAALVIAVASLAGVLMLLSLIEPRKLLTSAASLVLIMGALALMFVATKKLTTVKPNEMKDTIKTLGVLTGIILVLGLVLAGLSWINNPGSTIAAAASLALILGALFGCLYLLSKSSDIDTATLTSKLKSLGIIALIMVALGVVLALISKWSDPSKVIASAGAMTLLIGALLGTLVVLSKSKVENTKNLYQAIGSLAMLAGIFTVLSFVLIALSNLTDPNGLITSVTALVILIAALTIVAVVLTKFAGTMKDGHSILTEAAHGFGILSLSLIALAVVLHVLDTIKDPSSILTKTAALIVLLGALTIVATTIHKFGSGKNANIGNFVKASTALVILSSVLVVLSGVLYALSKIKNCDGILAKTTSVILLLSALTIVASVLSKFSVIANKNIGSYIKAAAALVILSSVLLVLTGVMAVLAMIKDPEGLVSKTMALCALLLAITVALPILAATSKLLKGTNVLFGVLGLLAMAVPLVAFVGILALMNKVENATSNAKALSNLVIALSLALVPLSLIGALIGATGGMALLGVAGLLLMAVPMITFVGILALMNKVPNAIENANALMTLMKEMLDMLVVLALIGPFAIVGVAAMQGLVLLIGEVAIFATAIGALVDKFPVLETFLDKGIDLMVRIADGLGEMLGAFVTSFGDKIAQSLPAWGTSLSMFMVSAQPFIAGVKMVDETFLTGIGNLTKGILMLTGAELLEAIASVFSGGDNSLAQLGTELASFMTNLQPFIDGAKALGADEAVLNGINSLSSAILKLTAAELLDGITRLLNFGEEGGGLESFGAQLAPLGKNMADFAANLGEFSDVQVTSITCAADAIQKMAEVAKVMPKEGGWLQKIIGDPTDIGTFASALPDLGTDMAKFAENLGTFSDDQVKTVTAAANALKAMAEAGEAMPTEGGWRQKLVGNPTDIGTFASKLPDVGAALRDFIGGEGKGLGGSFTETEINTIDAACHALRILADTAKVMPENKNLWEDLCGGDQQTLKEFSKQLPGLGKTLKSFITNIGSFGPDQVATVNSAANAVSAIAQLGKVDLGALSANLPTLGTNMTTFADKLKAFCSSIIAIDSASLDGAIDNVNKIVNMLKNLGSANAEAAAAFSDSLGKIGSNGVNAFIEAFNNKADSVRDTAKKLLTNFVDAAKSKSETAKTSFTDIAKACASALKSETVWQKFYNAGSYLVDGFVLGIDENDFKAEAQAAAMGLAALKAAKEAIASNSPAKKFIEVGKSVPEGFAIGIDKLGYMVSASSEEMGNTAIDGVKNSIANIGKVISSDVETQPTIRPVLDLTDVRSGANELSSMFGSGTSIGVMSNLRSIGHSMNKSSQNGANDDVVDAIHQLRDRLDTLETPSYTINGVTYDDGSNIADAVKTIVRAAKVERRT